MDTPLASAGTHTFDTFKIGPNVAIVSYENYSKASFAPQQPTRQNIIIGERKQDRDYDVMRWGKNNDLPSQREALATDNSLLPRLMETASNAYVGEGLMAYEEVFENGKRRVMEVEMPDVWSSLFDRMDIDEYLDAAAGELVKHSSLPVSFRQGVEDFAVYDIKVMRNEFCRKVKKKNGISPGIIYHAWNSRDQDEKKLINARFIPTAKFDKSNRLKSTPSSIWYQNNLFTDGYYAIPPWWGTWDWADLSNKIPKARSAEMDNGFGMGYHIEVPNNYFHQGGTPMQQSRASIKSGAGDDPNSADKIKNRRQQFVRKLNEHFQGITNQGRVLLTTYEINVSVGKEFPGVKVHVLDNPQQKEALVELYNATNQAIISAMGVPPALAAIQIDNKLGSGAEIRNQFIMYMALQTRRPRALMLKPLYQLAKANGYTGKVKLGFRDLDITKLDESKSGTKEVVAGQRAEAKE